MNKLENKSKRKNDDFFDVRMIKIYKKIDVWVKIIFLFKINDGVRKN